MLLKEPPWRARGWTVRLIIMSSSLFALSIAGCKDTPTPPAAKKPHPALASAEPIIPSDSGVSTASKSDRIPVRKRVHRVFAGGEQSRSAWSRRLILDERFEKHMCKADGYLLNCVGEFRNPDTRVTGPFSKRDCYQAVRDIVGKELGRGQGKWNVAGAFYSDELPVTIQAGRDMDLFAARLARRIGQVLIPAIRRHGGQIDTGEKCRRMLDTAFDVDGN